MTRTEKLEEALLEVQGQVSTWAPWLGRKIAEALATPPTKPQQTTMPDWDDPPYTRSSCKVTTKRYNISPSTSEWNEAVDEAWRACRKLHSLEWQQGVEGRSRDSIIDECENAIRALKRKEQS